LLALATAALGSLIAGGLGMPAAAYLLSPARKQGGPGWVDGGALEDLSPGAAAEIQFRVTRVDGWRIASEKRSAWLVRLDADKVAAYSPFCTHLGCAYHFDASRGRFACPCHTSFFSLQGEVLSGPAPRPLDRHQVKVEDGRVWIGELRRSE
jgi:menaquinol-cytochrome c reductase iron-sulfur subunit